MARGSDQVEFSHNDFPDSQVKSRACVNEKRINWHIGDINGVVDGLGKEKSTKFMTHIRTKKLSLGFCSSPFRNRELSYIVVKSLGKKRTS